MKLKYAKKLYKGFANLGGRNSSGHITVRHWGSGNKSLIRLVDNYYKLSGVVAKIFKIFKDPKKSGYLAAVIYSNGYYGFVRLLKGLIEGNYFVNTKNGYLYRNIARAGNGFLLKYVKEGEFVSSLELSPGSGAKIGWAAGIGMLVVKQYLKNGTTLLKLSSGEFRLFDNSCYCLLGNISHAKHSYIKYYKAGQTRWCGLRPRVRGEAMNPVDHPHGGRTKGGWAPVTPWGKLTKGVWTWKNKLINNNIVSNRRVKFKIK